MLNRVSVRLFLNMLIPLLIGLFFYLTSGKNTYLSSHMADLGVQLMRIQYPLILQYYFCDFLWGYSLYSGLRLFINNRSIVLLISISTASVMESIQLLSFVPGTFDVCDILVESLGIVIALLTTQMIIRRHKNEETTNA